MSLFFRAPLTAEFAREHLNDKLGDWLKQAKLIGMNPAKSMTVERVKNSSVDKTKGAIRIFQKKPMEDGDGPYFSFMAMEANELLPDGVQERIYSLSYDAEDIASKETAIRLYDIDVPSSTRRVQKKMPEPTEKPPATPEKKASTTTTLRASSSSVKAKSEAKLEEVMSGMLALMQRNVEAVEKLSAREAAPKRLRDDLAILDGLKSKPASHEEGYEGDSEGSEEKEDEVAEPQKKKQRLGGSE